ncbi:restriction endonuclease subunit S [Ruminococcus sp. 1001136sp1]|nr:restriction endonuclease subunit S [Ruminococcus sp. 1001136sp1]MDB8781336.1 restriction endonuclease subunit S [Ruminococcus sp. 1001136sp1]
MTGQQLKNSILQMAVQGKLVPQDPNDEPASVLLARIRAEKEQLIKEGKIKKEKNPSIIFRGADNLPYEKVGKNEPVCIADEIPFNIPDTWEWVRLGEIYQHNTGKALNASNRSGELLTYITTSNLYWNRFEIDSLREMYFSESEIEKCTATKGDLLVCEGGDIGRAAIWPYDTDIRIQNHIHRLRPYSEICTEYYYYIFFFYKHAGWIGGKGIGIQGLSANALHALLFPLPPLSEQYRIVTKIKEFEPLLDKYAQAEKRLNNLNTQFPDLLKKSILQEAVQGKLVPQDPTDEPASILLERIRAEKEQLIKAGKIKRDKHESVIFRRDNSHYEKLDGIERCIDDELPFEIPESWKWVRLGSVFQHNTGKALNAANRSGKKKPYITTSNLYWGRFELDKLKEMFFTEAEIERCTATKGDLLVCEGGDIGRAAIWPYDYDICIQNHIHRLRAYAPVCTKFFYYLFYLYKNAGWIGGKGIGIQGLSSNAIHLLLFPLPPLAEQEKIVEEIEKVFPVVSGL